MTQNINTRNVERRIKITGESLMTYVSVKLPKTLGQQIDDISQKRGYASRAEFVKDACRRLIEDIKNEGEGAS